MRLVAFTFIIAFLISCNEDTDFVAKNEKEIIDYIETNSLTAQKSASGLYYVVDKLGTGRRPTTSSTVTVAYKGYLTDGTVFDESDSKGISFALFQVIAGWTEGMTYFREGGSGILLVPSHLGYGDKGSGPIPGGAVIIFDVSLIAVQPL